MDDADVFLGGVISRARRDTVKSLIGQEGELTALECSYDAQETPGPSSYDTSRHDRSLSPRNSARIGLAPRDTSWYVDELDCGRPRGRYSSPGPQYYNAQAAEQKCKLRRSSSARMVAPREDVLLTPTGIVYKDLSHDHSPGPAAYHVRSSCSRQSSTLFGRELRRTGEWFASTGRVHVAGIQGELLVLPRSRSARSLIKSASSPALKNDTFYEAPPGPATYKWETSAPRALTAQSARMSEVPRTTSQSARGVPEINPGPAFYDVETAWRHAAHPYVSNRCPSARSMSPRSPFSTYGREGEFLVHDLNRSLSPGPAAYNPTRLRVGLVGSSSGAPHRSASPRSPRRSASPRSQSQQMGRCVVRSVSPRKGSAFEKECDSSSTAIPASTPVSLEEPRDSQSEEPRDYLSEVAFEPGTLPKPQAAGDGQGAWRQPRYLRATFTSRRKADIVAGARGSRGAAALHSRMIEPMIC